MKHAWIIIASLNFLVPGAVNAQLDNSFFHDDYPISSEDSAKIKLGVEFLGFLRNNEFKGEIIPGFTLFGYQFKPYITYFPSSRIRLELGGFFLKDFGNNEFREIRPLVTVKYVNRNFSMLFGTLEGALSHRLIEPLYNFERIINERIEDGFQLKYSNHRIYADAWIEWVNMIEFGDDALEEFNVGFSFNHQILNYKKFKLEIPLQLLANHRGGEIDTSVEPANTLFNASVGLGFVFPIHDNTLKAFRIDSYYTKFITSGNYSGLPFSDGEGWFLNVSSELKWIVLLMSYWHGNQFYAPNGGPLYQSLSFDYANDNYLEFQRDLLFMRVLFEHEFRGGLTLAFRFEPVFDFNNNHFDHSEGLYLRFRMDRVLNRKRKP